MVPEQEREREREDKHTHTHSTLTQTYKHWDNDNDNADDDDASDWWWPNKTITHLAELTILWHFLAPAAALAAVKQRWRIQLIVHTSWVAGWLNGLPNRRQNRKPDEAQMCSQFFPFKMLYWIKKRIFCFYCFSIDRKSVVKNCSVVSIVTSTSSARSA